MRVSSTARSNFSGVALKPGASPYIRNGMAICGDGGQHQKHEHEAGQGFFGELARGLAALAFQAPGKQRHEGRVEGTLAEQAAEQVGEAEGDEEGVGHRAGCPASPRSGCRGRNPRMRLTMVRPPTVAKAR